MTNFKYFVLGVFISVGVASCTEAIAHEMTPTYPKWQTSAFEHILETTVEIFNKREDVEYYELGVFDKDWKPVPFVSSYKVLQLKYLDHVSIAVYIRRDDFRRAVYVCSKSKLRKEDVNRTAVSSKICSKFKSGWTD